MSVPADTYDGGHLLKMDGVLSSFQRGLFHDRQTFTINMGKNSVEDLWCDSTTYDDLLLPAAGFSHHHVHEVPLIKLNRELRLSGMIFKSDDNYDNMFELDTSYRVMECVFNEE